MRISLSDLGSALNLDLLTEREEIDVQNNQITSLIYSLNGDDSSFVIISEADLKLINEYSLSDDKIYILANCSITNNCKVLFSSVLTYQELFIKLTHYLCLLTNDWISIHAELVNVSGIGVLVIGKSGIGKSEAALDLIKLGHELISDDQVEIYRTNDHMLIGKAPKNIRGYLEIRGIGIVNYKEMFGIKSFSLESKIDMICELKALSENTEIERIGLNSETREYLGVSIPYVTIPVFTGRNNGLLIESAALNQKLKNLGYNSASEFIKAKGE